MLSTASPDEVEKQGRSSRHDLLLLGGLALICFVLFGATLSSLGLYQDPARQAFGWSQTEASAVAAAFALAIAISAAVGGWLVGIFGPRRVMMAGSVLVGIGYCTASIIDNPLGYIAAFATAGFGVGGATVVPCTYVASRYIRIGLGLSMGIILCAASTGSTILPIVVQAFIEHFGWRSALGATGACVLLVTLPVIMLLVPNGERQPDQPSAGSDRFSRAVAVPWTPLALVVVMQMFFQMSYMGLYIHFVPLFSSLGFTASTAVLFFAIQNALSAVALLVVGWLADRWGPFRIMVVAIFLSAGSILLLHLIGRQAPSTMLLAGFIVGWGVSGGCSAQLAPLLIREAVPVAALGRA
ncbi:MAG: MFS transporter, partial [Novosphingobium sp.]